jgi:hypothetical protein
MTNGAGHGRSGVVRGCPLGTGQNCCEWHDRGTAGENDVVQPISVDYQVGRMVRPVLVEQQQPS